MARKRASMREGPLAELFRATEAAQRAQGDQPEPTREAPEAASPEPEAPTQLPLEPEQPTAPETRGPVELEATVEHVYDFEVGRGRPSEEAAVAAARGGAGRGSSPDAPGRGARCRGGRGSRRTRGACRHTGRRTRARAARGAVRAAREPVRHAHAGQRTATPRRR